MKHYIQFILIIIGSGTISCSENGKSTEIDRNDTLEVVQENGQITPKDSIEYLDKGGSKVPIVIQETDSINMPQELINMIENTTDLHPDSILVKRRFKEDGITYFELEFKMEGNQNETFIFDENGKRRNEF